MWAGLDGLSAGQAVHFGLGRNREACCGMGDSWEVKQLVIRDGLILPPSRYFAIGGTRDDVRQGVYSQKAKRAWSSPAFSATFRSSLVVHRSDIAVRVDLLRVRLAR